MSAKHIRTTADLIRFQASVRIDCRDCAAARTMTGPEVVSVCGVRDFDSLEARLRCSRCGARSARLTVLPPIT
jgi:rubredoxin